MPKLLSDRRQDSNPGSLDCESGVLPLNHRAPQPILYKFSGRFTTIKFQLQTSITDNPYPANSLNTSIHSHYHILTQTLINDFQT